MTQSFAARGTSDEAAADSCVPPQGEPSWDHPSLLPAGPTPDPFGLVGSTLAGKYDIERVVAETELSIVYRAAHRVWKRPIAIKAFKAPALGESAREQLLESFVREGALLMELSERCAAICQARDVGSVITPSGDWVPYTVLEWLDGEPLDVMLTRERDLGAPPRMLDEAIRLLDPIARALGLAHERGIAHGDVKPGNIFVLAESTASAANAKLLDFGVAKVAALALPGADRPSMHAFTPAYGAPEQFSTEYGQTGPATDVFALALIMVELMSGRDPLRGDTVEQLAWVGCNPERRPTPREEGVAVSDAVERVFRRALAVSALDRYDSAGDFWFALLQAAQKRREARSAAPAAVPADAERVTIPVALTNVRKNRHRSWVKPALALIGAVTCVAALSRYSPWLSAVHTVEGPAPAAAATAAPMPQPHTQTPGAPR